MKTIGTIVVALALLCLSVPGAHAAKPAKAKAKATKTAQKNGNVIARYDKNGNGFIDADEVEAVKKAFSSDSALKRFDKNGDGKLDDIEVSAMNPSEKKKKK